MNASYWDCSALLVMSPGSGIETEVPELIWMQSLFGSQNKNLSTDKTYQKIGKHMQMQNSCCRAKLQQAS